MDLLGFVEKKTHQLTCEEESALLPYQHIFAKLLYNRGIYTAEQAESFLNPSLDQLLDPMLLSDMDKAKAILLDAREKQLPTVVYTDFDVDGICSGSLMVQALARFNLAADRKTPLRSDGYGLNCDAVKELAQKYKLLITVDLGITNHEEVQLAKDLGMTVIVTDHHALGPNGIPPADAVINPVINDYPTKLCGTGVAFKLAQALLGLESCGDFLDLAALATVADIVPLKGENRVLVACGLQVINERKRVGLAALMDVCNKNGVASEDIAFFLAPRLNAAGRMKDASDAFSLLMTCDPDEAQELARTLNELNEQRKNDETKLLGQISQEAAEHDFVTEKMLIIRGKGWNPGVVGLAAGRLNEQYHCPVCVLCEKEDLLVGSLRSIPGIHIQQCLTQCDDLLIHYGGHAQAAGVTLSAQNYAAFCERLQKAVAACAEDSVYQPILEYEEEVSLAECTEELLSELRRLEPFGCENPVPLFLCRDTGILEKSACGTNKDHLRLTFQKDGHTLHAIAFRKGKLVSILPGCVDVAFELGENNFNHQVSLQMQVKELISSRDAQLWALHNETMNQQANSFLTSVWDSISVSPPLIGDAPNLEQATWEQAIAAAISHERGHLFTAHCADTAIDCLTQVPHLVMERYYLSDPRCFPVLLYHPHCSVCGGHMKHVWLLDGEGLPNEALLWHQRMPDAIIHVLPQSNALHRIARQIDIKPTKEQVQVLQKWCLGSSPVSVEKASELIHLSVPQLRFILYGFVECGWIDFEESPFRLKWHGPQPAGDMPLVQHIRALAKESGS